MAAQENGQDVTLVKISSMCRICLTEDDQHSINVLNTENNMQELVKSYFGIKINGNEQKSTMLCLTCQLKIQTWLEDMNKAKNNQIVVNFLATRSSSNLVEKDHSVELQTDNSIVNDVANTIPHQLNNSLINSKTSTLCPFCNNFDKTAKIDKNNFCKRHFSPYTCLIPKCYSVFPSKEVLIPHYRSHLNLPSNSFLCNICLNVLDCPRSESKKKHIHQNLPKLFTCCSTRFPTMTDFVCHKLQYHHARIISKKYDNFDELSNNSPRQVLKRSRKNKKLVKSAKKIKVDEVNTLKLQGKPNPSCTGIYVCKLCPSLFTSLSLFVEHSEKMHDILYQLKENQIKLCPLCDENYEFSNYFEHVSKCTNSMVVGENSINTYGCIHCLQVFSDMTASQFRKHFNYCRSFEVDKIINDNCEKTRKCKNCMFESTILEDCVEHANSHCIYYKLKIQYSKESCEITEILRRKNALEQIYDNTSSNLIKLEVKSENEKINFLNCDWSRQKLLESYNYLCNNCNKGFFSRNIFLNHLSRVGVRCRDLAIIYCRRCITDFDSVDSFNNHLQGPPPPPPCLPIMSENRVATITDHRPFIETNLSESIKIEPSNDELNENTHFYSEENIVMINNNTNNLQYIDDNDETKDSTLFQEFGDSKSMIHIKTLKESEETIFINQSFQKIEVSNDTVLQSIIKVDEDKPNVNSYSSN